MPTPLLDIRGLATHFLTPGRPDSVGRAVDGVDLRLHPGETLGLVGESGCGKTMLALSVLGLLPRRARLTAGQILFDGQELANAPEAALRKVRGRDIGMIFQEPMTSLNPVLRVGEQIAEAVRLHLGASPAQALAAAVDMLAEVGIPDPARRARSYPHELSGGMRQRVVIAMALVLGPRLLLADEPTTALDVTIQAEILELIARLKAQRGTSVLLVSHNLGVVAQSCARVAVMYSGKIVEQAPVRDFFDEPLHPYARLLLASVPRIGRRQRLAAIGGTVPSIFELPPGCHFQPRCPQAFERCAVERPALYEPRPGHLARCFLYA